ncbi:hypothetical protein ACIQ9J_19220 [Streptomyces sp. NPDC094153]|uniref:hypothetical protein n=1 Tax=Streptomyces sp. NPDC094153 TaxID=3366058 RepID=UPI0038298039
MGPRLRKIGDRLVTGVALVWFGHQALYGQGIQRIVSILMLVIGAVTTAGALFERVNSRPKRRRSRERDADGGESEA